MPPSRVDRLLEQLDQLPDSWPLVAVDGNKRAYQQGWQKNPLTKQQITEEIKSGRAHAVGIASGPLSGILFLDHDGSSATDQLQRLGIPLSSLPQTIAVTSGRVGRFQLLFNIPKQYWKDLPNRKFWHTGEPDPKTKKPTKIAGDDGKAEQIDFRWSNHYSIVIGAHPKTTGYHWLPNQSPADLPIAEAPKRLIDLLLKKTQNTTTPLLSRTIPFLDFISRDTRQFVETGGTPGCWNDDQLKYSLDLIGTEHWIRSQGFTPDISALDAFNLHIQNAKNIDSTFDERKAFHRFNGAQQKNPHPSTPADKLFQRLQYHTKSTIPAKQTPPEKHKLTQNVDPPRDQQIQLLLDQLLDQLLDPTDPWAKQQAIRADLWNLGVKGDAIDNRLLYALAERWHLPLQVGHSGARRGRSIRDPLDSPAEDLLPGFLLWRRDHVLFGPGGAGKTMAAAAMGVAILKGRPFLDQQIPPDRTGRILWIGSDGGEGARAMVAEYLEDLGVADDPDVVDGFTVWSAEGADNVPAWACSPRGLLELKEELQQGDYALVVIDSLKAVLELAGINFGIGPVGTLMRFMQALVGRHASLLWLHHPAGGKAAGKGLQAAAGSQNINQIPSGVHQINRIASERGPINEWTVHKLRGATSREFSYRLAEDGFEVTKGEITGNARADIIDCIELRSSGGLGTRTALIVKDLNISEWTVRNNLTWLRKRGLVSKKGTAWRLTEPGRRVLGLIQLGEPNPWTQYQKN